MRIKDYEENICERNFEISEKKRKELGEYIKKIREEKNISLTQLADLTKINVSDLHKIEKGTKNKVNPFQLKAISKILQVDYKIFYRIVNFLEDKDFNSKQILVNEKSYSKDDLVSILDMYYPKMSIGVLLEKFKDMKASQINEVLLFTDFIKEKKQ